MDRLGIVKIWRWLLLAALSVAHMTGAAFADDRGAFALAPGEVRYARIGSVYREIRVCNDLESTGDLVVVIADEDPHRLAPGMCKWGHGARVVVRNDTKSIVLYLIQVIGKHQS